MSDLVQRLREQSLEKQQVAGGRLDGGQDLFIGAMLADEAANRIEMLEALCERLRMEAEIQAQEMRTQRSTVRECYQAATGATGEPGDWNGSKPVVERIKALEAENERLREALRFAEEHRKTAAYSSSSALTNSSSVARQSRPASRTGSQ